MRLDRFLAEAGCGTRKEVKKIIQKGQVTVNGLSVKDPAAHVNEAADAVMLDGKPVLYEAFSYYLLNKPKGVISASRADIRTPGTPCVTDLITESRRDDLFPVGRLDKDTEGLLLITNDGALAHDLLSPAKHVDKTYYAELDGNLREDAAKRIEQGVDIGDEKPTLPCRIRCLGKNTCEIKLHEGRYHQVKRMFLTEGLTVTYLKRLSMGGLTLPEDLKPGEYRKLLPEELREALRQQP